MKFKKSLNCYFIMDVKEVASKINSSTSISARELDELIRKCRIIREQLELFLKKGEEVPYTGNETIDRFINEDSLAPIIGTICDERIKAETAWSVPYYLREFLKQKGLEFKPSSICKLGRKKLRNWFVSFMQDKWPSGLEEKDRKEWLDKIPKSIVATCKKIWKEYDDDPDNIFTVNNGNLSVPLVYYILRQFPGIGPKKATMIAREFGRGGEWFKSVKARLKKRGINFKVKRAYFTEIPIDVHVKMVLKRLGFARYREVQDIQNLARIIYPENPGLVDLLIWKIGREWCVNPPTCEKDHDVCPLSSICDYYNQIYKRYK
jgi:endonuclease III